jgi:ribosomal protein L7/L12
MSNPDQDGERNGVVRITALQQGAQAIYVIMVIREFTAMSLAEAKQCLDRLESGQIVELKMLQNLPAAGFAAKLNQWGAVAQVVPQAPEHERP